MRLSQEKRTRIAGLRNAGSGAEGDCQLPGVVSLEKADLTSQMGDLNAIAVGADSMRTVIVTLQDTDSIDRALQWFFENQLLKTPVVYDSDQHVVGLVHRANISSTYLREAAQSSGEAASRSLVLGPASPRGMCYNCLFPGR